MTSPESVHAAARRIAVALRLLPLALALLVTQVAASAHAAPPAGADEPAAAPAPERLWIKTQENRSRQYRLAVAARRYVPADGEGPTITLAGAVHIGDAEFYAALQELVDEHDLVLFEGVGDHPRVEEADDHALLPASPAVAALATLAAPDAASASDDPPAEEGPDGIQKQLANTLGLTFQLEEMDSGRAHWRNSDMSLDEVRAAIGESGDNADMLFSMLDGSSFMAQMMGAMLEIIERIPGASVRMKVLMMETLASADDMLMAGGPLGENVMKVIIEDRNQVVIDDLKGILALGDEDIHTIAVLYGAGHLTDMEARLIEQLGYEYDSTRWLTAIQVDLEEAGIDASEMRMWRTMLRQQMAVARAQMARAAASEEEGEADADEDAAEPDARD